MMSFTTATAHNVLYKGSDALNHAEHMSPYRRGADSQPCSRKAKSGKWSSHDSHKRPNDDHNVLLHRLSMSSSSPPPPGSLLERIGGIVEVEGGTDSDQVDVTSEGEEVCTDLPFSSSPRFQTPEPGEVERFLQSVIGVPTSPHVYSGHKPTLALQTYNLHLPVDHHLRSAEDPPSSMLYSPTQTAVNSLPSANIALDHCQKSPFPLGDTMPPLSASTIEECKKHVVPVLLASARARDPGTHLDSEQCHKLLSDDHCTKIFWQAKEMRRQLSSMMSPKLPVHQSSNGALKRDRVDEVEAWTRNTRSRFHSTNPAISDASRKDSDITLVDFAGGRSPPRAPRAMLHASQVTSKNGSVDSALDGAPKISSLVDARLGATHEALIASPTTEDRPANVANVFELAQRAGKMLPMPRQPLAEIDTSSNVSVGQSSAPQSRHPHQVVSPTQPTLSSAADFVSHSPTQPGIWFKQQGRKYSEVVNVDVDLSREMFYLSAERLPSRIRMHLHLCSVPTSSLIRHDVGDTAATIKDVIDRRALRWPKKGALVVQINPDSEGSKTWLHHHLESDPLDVTSCIRPGKNVFRFIQLSDLSDYTFVLVASPPPEEEAWRSWDWASLVTRPHVNGASSSSGLSEFTHLPVTIRSRS